MSGSAPRVDPVRLHAVRAMAAGEREVFLDAAIDRERRDLPAGSPEGRRLQFLATGATKWRGRLDQELEKRLPRGLKSLPGGVRAVLRIGLFEIRFAETPGWAAVDAAVETARALGHDGLTGVVNGVLRAAEREGEPDPGGSGIARMAWEHSHPEWLLEAVAAAWGVEAAEAFARWNNEPAPLWVRVDLSRMDPGEAALLLASEGFRVGDRRIHAGGAEIGAGAAYLRLEGEGGPGRLSGVRDGWLTVQDPSAGLAVLALGDLSGRRVLDLCAAPGGKATFLAERPGMPAVEATDSDPVRRALLEENVSRHGARVRVRRWEDLVEGGEKWEVLLLDVPCSNTGVLRRRADARWRLTPGEPARMAAVQAALLARGAELLQPGGVLLYSTCAILAEENESVVETFLEGHPRFALEALPPDIPVAFVVGTGVARCLPWRDGMDGAFVARLRKERDR